MGGGRRGGEGGAVVPPPTDASILGDPQKAFAYFRERHPGKAALDENKTLLGQKYARAKVGDSGGCKKIVAAAAVVGCES